MDDIDDAIGWAAVFVFLYGLLVPLGLAARYVPSPSTSGRALLVIPSYIGLLLTGFALVVRPAVFLRDWKLITLELCVLGTALVVAVVGVAAIPTYVARLQDWWCYSVVAFFLAVIFLIGGFVALAIVTLFVRVSGDSLNRLRAPASVATCALIDSLAAIYQAKGVPYSLAQRNYILGRIEDAARAIETLGRHVQLEDAGTLTWSRTVTARVAATLRYEKRPFALGRATDDPAVVERFTEYVKRAVSGDWAAIDGRDPEHRSNRQRLARVGKLSEGALVAFVPAATLFLLWDRLSLRAPFSEYVKVGAIVWGALALALSWDPAFAAKLLAAKSILGGKDKE